MPTTLDADNLRDLAMGAAILSAGGGSYPYLETLVATDVLARAGPVELIDIAALPETANVALVAMAGAPLPLFERFVDADHFAQPVRVLEKHLGRPFDAIAGYEIGSMNGIIPVMVAARLGLPLVDIDTLGRSFPEARMTSLALAGVDMSPVVLSDIRGNDVIIQAARDGQWTETILRAVATCYGAIAAVGGAISATTLRQYGIKGTVSRAIRMGRALLLAQEQRSDPIEGLLRSERGVAVVRGRVTDVERVTAGGFVRGKVMVTPTEGGVPVTVHFQNEYTVVEGDSGPISCVPDLICIFDSQRGEPIGTEALRYAQQVTVVTLPPCAIHVSDRALAIVGPRGFGYSFDYVSPHQGMTK